MRSFIIEGVTAAGKSTVLAQLQSHLLERVPAATKVFLSEHYTERLFEDAVKQPGISGDSVLDHVGALCRHVEFLHTLQHQGKFAGRRGGNSEIYVLLERFLGAHFANLRVYAKQDTLDGFVDRSAELYAQLAALGFEVAILVPDTNYLRSAIADTLTRRNSAWRSFLENIGSQELIVEHFCRWQRELEHYYSGLRRAPNVHYFEVTKRDDLRRIADAIGARMCLE